MLRLLSRLAVWISLAGCAVAQADVAISVDWATAHGTTPAQGYGTNIFSGLDPAVSARPAYLSALKTMGVSVLRLHANAMVRTGDDKSWVKADGVTWDAPKIAAVFDNLSPLKAEIIVNIPGWPSRWNQPGGDMLDPAHYDDYARFCAQLVELINNQQKRGVALWENVNERELKFPADAQGMGAYGEIFRRSAAAMRQASSTPIKVSPAWMNLSQQARLELFLADPGVRENLGFFAFHQYATAKATDLDGSDGRNQHLFDRAAEIAAKLKNLRAYLDANGLSGLPLVYDEYHLAATYDIDAKHLMHGPVAMVFFALLHKHIVEGGTNALLLSWNERDGAYGLMDQDHRLRPTGTLLQFSNRTLRGTCYPATSSERAKVEAFAVQSSPKGRAVLLINRSAAPSPIQLTMTGWQPNLAYWFECQLSVEKTPTLKHASQAGTAPALTLPPYSVTLCLFADSP